MQLKRKLDIGPREETNSKSKRLRGELDSDTVLEIEVQEQMEEDKVNVSGEKKERKASKRILEYKGPSQKMETKKK